MRIEQIGQFRVALDLEWVDVGDSFNADNAVSDFANKNQVSNSSVCYTHLVGDNAEIVGLGCLDGPENSKMVPLAAAVAMQGDGVYIISLIESADVWVCVIRDRLVVREQIVARSNLRTAIDMQTSMPGVNRDIFVGPGTGVTSNEYKSFEPMDVLSNAALENLQMLRLNHHPGAKRILAVVAVVAVALAGTGLYFHTHHKPDLAKVRAQRIAAYISTARARIGGLSIYDWTHTAYMQASSVLTPFVGGMSLAEIQCTPIKCQGRYLPKNARAVYSTMAIKKVYGSSAKVQTLRGRSSVVVTVVLPKYHRYRVDTKFLNHPPFTAVTALNPISDWTGSFRLWVPDAKVIGVPKIITLANGVAVGYPAIRIERVAMSGNQYMGMGVLDQVMKAAQFGGFVITQMNWSPGYIGRAGWRVAIVRVVLKHNKVK